MSFPNDNDLTSTTPVSSNSEIDPISPVSISEINSQPGHHHIYANSPSTIYMDSHHHNHHNHHNSNPRPTEGPPLPHSGSNSQQYDPTYHKISPPPPPPSNDFQYLTHYQVLGISQNADLQIIKSAYRHLFFAYHPDRTGDHSAQNIDFITRLQAAYQVLSDDLSRKTYDLQLTNTAAKSNLISCQQADGLETFSLDTFTFTEQFDQNRVLWQKDCPRCNLQNSINLSDWDLENCGTKVDNEGGYLIVVQCGACSICINVSYYDLDDEDGDDEEEWPKPTTTTTTTTTSSSSSPTS